MLKILEFQYIIATYMNKILVEFYSQSNISSSLIVAFNFIIVVFEKNTYLQKIVSFC